MSKTARQTTDDEQSNDSLDQETREAFEHLAEEYDEDDSVGRLARKVLQFSKEETSS